MLKLKTKIVLIFFIIFFLLGLLSYLIINSKASSEFVKSILTDVIENKFSTKLKLKQINFEYFPPAISIKDIKLYNKENAAPFFTSNDLKVSLRMFQLFLGEIMLEKISATSPYLDLDINDFKPQEESKPLANNPPAKKRLDDLKKLFEIKYFSLNFREIYITNGNFLIKDSSSNNEIKINNVNIDFKTSLFTKDRLLGKIDSIKYFFQNEKKRDFTFLFNNIDFNAGLGVKTLKFYSLDFNLFSQKISINNTIIKDYLTEPQLDVNFFSELNIKTLFAHHKIPGEYNGSVKLDGNITGSPYNFLAKGSLSSTELSFNSLKCGTTELKYDLKDNVISLEEIKTILPSGNLLGNIAINITDNFNFIGALKTEKINLEDILNHVSVKDAFVELKFSGETAFSGQLIPFFINVDSNFNFDHLKVFGSSYNDRNRKTVFSLPAGSIKSKYFISNDHVKINQALIKLKQMPSYAEIEANFPYNNSMYLKGKIKSLDLNKIKILNFQQTGLFSGSLEMDGTFSNLKLTVPFEIAKGHFNNIPFDKTEGNARWFKNDLTFSDLKTEFKNNSFLNNIFINFKNSTELSFDIGIKNFDIKTIDYYYNVIPKSLYSHLKKTTGILKGNLELDFDHNLNPSGFIDISGNHLSYFEDIKDLELKLSADIENSKYIIKKGLISKDDSSFEIRGTYDLENGLVTGSAFGDIYSKSFNFFHKKYGISEAYLNIFGEISGITKSPELYLKLRLSPFKLFNEPIGNADINLSLDKSLLSYGNLFDNKLSFVLSENQQNYSLSFQFKQYNFGKMLDMYLNSIIGRNLNHSILLSANANLQTSKPLGKNLMASTTGEIIIDKLLIDSTEMNLRNVEQIKINFKNNTINCLPFVLSSNQKKSKDQISFSLSYTPKGLTIQSKGELQTTIIQPLFEKKHIIFESGSFNFNSKYSSLATNETFINDLELINNKLLLVESSIPISSVNGSIIMRNNQLSLNNFSGKFGIGDFTLDGSANLTSPSNLNFDIRFKNGQISYKDKLNATLDGNFNLIGTEKPYTLTGNSFINNLTYSGNFDWKTMLMRRKGVKFLPKTTKDITPILNFNISLASKENFLIDNNFARINFQTDLMLLGTNDNPILNGGINAIGGHFYYQKHKFEINSLSLSFNDSIKIDPHYSINAQTTIEDKRITQTGSGSEGISRLTSSGTYQLTDEYNISLTTSGYLSNLSQNLLNLTSSPPLSSISLAHLLTFGRTIPQDEELDSETRKAAIFEIVSGQLQEALERETQKAIKGLTLRIEPRVWESSNSTATAIVIEKDISDKLSLKGSKVLDSKTDDQAFKVEYKLSPHVSVSSGLEESSNSTNETVDLEIRLPFGR